MVAVGDDQLLIGHGILDGVDVARICHYPQAVNHAIFVGEFGNWRGGGLRLVKNLFDALLWIGIQHEKLAGVHARMAKQFEAVGLWAGESMFVAENDAGGIFFEPACANEAAARALFGRSGNSELLRIGVESRGGILKDEVIANPLVYFVRSAGVDIILRRIVRENAALFDGDQILRVHGVVFGLALGRNLVVGLGEDAVEGSELRIETVRAKWEYLGHEFSDALQHDCRNQYFKRRRAENATRVLK